MHWNTILEQDQMYNWYDIVSNNNGYGWNNAQWAHWALQGHNNITCGVADIQSSLADILSSLADILSCLADILSDGAKICLSKGYFAPIWLCFWLSKDKIYTSIKKYSD